MNFLGIDPSSSKTGWALLMERGRSIQVETGSFSAPGKDINDKAYPMGIAVRDLMRDLRRREIVLTSVGVENPLIVMPKASKTRQTLWGPEQSDELVSNPHTMRIMPAMAAVACFVVQAYGHPEPALVQPATWRKSFIGIARAPKHVPKGKTSKWLKNEVRAKADLLGQRHDFKVPNFDVSDAVGIVFHMAATSGSEPAVSAMLRAA